MWPFSNSRAPDTAQFLRKRVDDLETRIGRLEESNINDRLKILDAAEKLARRLQDRDKKREERDGGGGTVRRPIFGRGG